MFFIVYFSYGKYQNIPRTMTEYSGITLGNTPGDVEFFKGKPGKYEYILKSSDGKVQVVGFREMKSAFKQGYRIEIDNAKVIPYVWRYDKDNSVLQITYHLTKATVKSVNCAAVESYACPSIFSIGINDTYNKVLKHFGTPPDGYQDLGDGVRYIYYPQFNVSFYLRQGKVYKLGIDDGSSSIKGDEYNVPMITSYDWLVWVDEHEIQVSLDKGLKVDKNFQLKN